MRNTLENAWVDFRFQDASVDLRQRDNEFHGASYVDFKTGKLIHGFTGVVEKPKRGALGQVEAFQQCISGLYPESKQIKLENVWELFRQHRQEHLNLVISRTVPRYKNGLSYPPKRIMYVWLNFVR